MDELFDLSDKLQLHLKKLDKKNERYDCSSIPPPPIQNVSLCVCMYDVYIFSLQCAFHASRPVVGVLRYSTSRCFWSSCRQRRTRLFSSISYVSFAFRSA